MPKFREIKRGKYGYDLESYCETGEWGNVTPILDIGCSTIIKGPGCEPITPFILIIMVLVIWAMLSYYIYQSRCEKLMLCLFLLVVGGFGLSFNLFWTGFTDPGFIKRKYDAELFNQVATSLYCSKCMVTFEEARANGIVHCYDCERCC